MTKTIQLLTLFLFANIGLYAVEIQWQKELPINNESAYSGTGSDGSAIVFSPENDTLYWIGSNGNIIYTIPDFTGQTTGSSVVNPESVSGTQLVLTSFDISGGVSGKTTKVITKTESEPSIVTLNGSSASESVFESSSPFFLTENGTQNETQYTLYKLDSTSSPSVGVTSVPANAIVIPASHKGDVTISLEASSDLVEWNNVLPGSYSSSNEARFFRVRAVTEN